MNKQQSKMLPILLLCLPIAQLKSFDWHDIMQSSTYTIPGAFVGGIATIIGLQWYRQQALLTKSSMQEKAVTPVGHLRMSGPIQAVDQHLQILHKFASDPSIRAILISIDSGGGNASTSSSLFQEINYCAQRKPVVVYIEGVCASGAYYAASAAHWIIAPNMANIGHIGVIKVVERHRNIKIQREGYSADAQIELLHVGKYKTLTYPTAPDLTPEERAHIKHDLETMYDLFCQNVAHARNLSLAARDIWANAQLFSAPKALELHLIDQIGSFSDALVTIEGLLRKRSGDEIGEIRFITETIENKSPDYFISD